MWNELRNIISVLNSFTAQGVHNEYIKLYIYQKISLPCKKLSEQYGHSCYEVSFERLGVVGTTANCHKTGLVSAS